MGANNASTCADFADGSAAAAIGFTGVCPKQTEAVVALAHIPNQSAAMTMKRFIKISLIVNAGCL